jgi:metal-responsive CopG/Arc/MetJ family transcriptional regulator
MKFPDMTVTTINLPTTLLEQIDRYANKRILNRSACVRELVTEALKDTTATPDFKVIAKRYAGIEEPLS